MKAKRLYLYYNLNSLIYPIPTISSLGIHSVLNLEGGVSFGPNIYKVEKIDYKINEKYKEQFYNEISQFVDIKLGMDDSKSYKYRYNQKYYNANVNQNEIVKHSCYKYIEG